jgi:hypothetical protein
LVENKDQWQALEKKLKKKMGVLQNAGFFI